MIPSLVETLAALCGAYRLTRFDPRGLYRFDPTTAACRRSFFAAAIIAPLYALVLAVRFGADPAAGDAERFAVVQAIAYVAGWTAYPVVMDVVTRVLGCRERLVMHITVYNWNSVLQYGVIAAIILLAAGDLVPAGIAAPLWMCAFGFFLAVSWYIARLTLQLAAFEAVGVVVVDVVLGILINTVADRVL